VDSEVMLGTLTQHGYSITHSKHEADVLVVNTCGFIDSAKQESIDTILEMAELKNTGNCRKLVVAGCLAEGIATTFKNRFRKSISFLAPTNSGRFWKRFAAMTSRFRISRSIRYTRRGKSRPFPGSLAPRPTWRI
jgi:tRNA A37 methylthiotransferase MiaB